MLLMIVVVRCCRRCPCSMSVVRCVLCVVDVGGRAPVVCCGCCCCCCLVLLLCVRALRCCVLLSVPSVAAGCLLLLVLGAVMLMCVGVVYGGCLLSSYGVRCFFSNGSLFLLRVLLSVVAMCC